MEGYLVHGNTGLVRISRLIDQERGRLGYSGRELAERAGLGVGTVSRILKGQAAPNLGTVEALAQALGYTLESFMALALGVSRKQKDVEELIDIYEALPQEDRETLLMLARYYRERRSSAPQP